MAIRVGHSADPDDAFMVWALEAGKVDTRGLELEPVASDIQTLNEWAVEGRLEVTALSAGAYPAVAERYLLLPHGASFGEGYGPIVVAREPLSLDELRDVEIATPGPLTTATRVLRLALGDDVRTRDLPFDEVLDEVTSGRAGRGPRHPRGSAHVRRCRGCTSCSTSASGGATRRGSRCRSASSPPGATSNASTTSRACSATRSTPVSHIATKRSSTRASFGRGIDAATADEFVAMYVNDLTLDMGERGRRAVAQLLGSDAGVRRLMPRAVVLSAVRTPVGRYGGALAGVRPDDLAAVAVRAAVDRAGVPEDEIEDVWLGCANQAGEDNRNVARMAVLLAGLPDSVAGVTVNRLCASGLAAIVGACHAVIAGDGDLFVAGGVESMSRAPLVTAKPDEPFPRGDRTLYDTTLGWRFPNERLAERFPLETMGETGENVAERWAVSREDQDAFALRSQRRWADAAAAGRFDDELVAVGEVTRDEHPRPDTSRGAARAAPSGVQAGRDRHGRQRVGHQRRRRGARDRLGGARARARGRAARRLRRLGRRRSRPARDGNRTGARRAQAARANRSRRRTTSTSSS